MDKQFQLDLIAELAVLNTAAMTALLHVARSTDNPQGLLKEVFDDGLASLRRTNYWSVPAEDREALLANIEGRWTDLITSIKPAVDRTRSMVFGPQCPRSGDENRRLPPS